MMPTDLAYSNRYDLSVPPLPLTPMERESGLSQNFDVLATVHNKTMCLYNKHKPSYVPGVTPLVAIKRKGCMNSTSVNYDPAATVSDPVLYPCYPKILGCLNPGALNFMCVERCTAPNCGACYTQVAGVPQPDHLPTLHNPYTCTYPNEGDVSARPPAPPPPFSPTNDPNNQIIAKYEFELQTSFSMTGSIEDILAQLDTIIAAINARMNSNYIPSRSFVRNFVTRVILGGYGAAPTMSGGRRMEEGRRLQGVQDIYEVVAVQLMGSQAEAEAAAALVNQNSASFTAADLTAALLAGGVTGIDVLSSPIATSVITVTYIPRPPEDDDGSNTGAIVGGVIGGLFAVLILFGGYHYYKKQKARNYDKQVVPA